MGGIQKGGLMLYQVDFFGSYFLWKVIVIGKSVIKVKMFLEKRYLEEFELEDVIYIVFLILKDNIEGEMNGDIIEIGELSYNCNSFYVIEVNCWQVLLVCLQSIFWVLRGLMVQLVCGLES